MRIIYATLLALLCGCVSSNTDKIQTAKGVDISRYLGEWFEIARFENRFERGLHSPRAIYSLNGDVITVQNFGTDSEGNEKMSKGSAYMPSKKDESKLRVTFFYPFYSDYLILELDPNYQWALVGSSSPEYLWILSRKPSLPEETLNKILNLAKSRGYDTSKFIYTQKAEAKR